MNSNVLRGKRIACGMSVERIASELGLTGRAYRNRELGKTCFSMEEVSMITRILNLSLIEFNDIFYDGELPTGNWTLPT